MTMHLAVIVGLLAVVRLANPPVGCSPVLRSPGRGDDPSWRRRFARTRALRPGRPPASALGSGIRVVGVLPVMIWVLGPPLAPFGLLLVGVLVRASSRRAARRRTAAAVAQLPDLVRYLANATEAGLSLTAAWCRAVDEVGDPLRPVLELVVADVELGAPLSAALERLPERLASDDVRFLVTTLVVQHRSGGDVVTALRRMTVALSERRCGRRCAPNSDRRPPARVLWWRSVWVRCWWPSRWEMTSGPP